MVDKERVDRVFSKVVNKSTIEIVLSGGIPSSFTYTIEKRPSVLVWDVVYNGEKNVCLFQYFGGKIRELQPMFVGNINESRARALFSAYLNKTYTNMKVNVLRYCSRCGRLLKDAESIKRGYGPECVKKVQENT